MRKAGFVRARIDGQVLEIETLPEQPKFEWHSARLFAMLEYMFQFDIDLETEWFLTASDEDALAFETDDAALHCEPAAIRSAVCGATHSMTVPRLNLLDIINEWDRADAQQADGARTPSAWLRSRLALSHGHAVALLKQARGLRNTRNSVWRY